MSYVSRLVYVLASVHPALYVSLPWSPAQHPLLSICACSLAEASARYGAHYVVFFRGRGDRFSAEPSRYCAADNLHPSAASYRVCFDEMGKASPLDGVLLRTPPPKRKKAPRKRKTYISVWRSR